MTTDFHEVLSFISNCQSHFSNKLIFILGINSYHLRIHCKFCICFLIASQKLQYHHHPMSGLNVNFQLEILNYGGNWQLKKSIWSSNIVSSAVLITLRPGVMAAGVPQHYRQHLIGMQCGPQLLTSHTSIIHLLPFWQVSDNLASLDFTVCCCERIAEGLTRAGLVIDWTSCMGTCAEF